MLNKAQRYGQACLMAFSRPLQQAWVWKARLQRLPPGMEVDHSLVVAASASMLGLGREAAKANVWLRTNPERYNSLARLSAKVGCDRLRR